MPETRSDAESRDRRYQQRDVEVATGSAGSQQKPTEWIDQRERQNRRREEAKNDRSSHPLCSEQGPDNLLRKDRAADRNWNRHRDGDRVASQERSAEAPSIRLGARQC